MKLIAAPNMKKILRAVISPGRLVLEAIQFLLNIQDDNTTQGAGAHALMRCATDFAMTWAKNFPLRKFV